MKKWTLNSWRDYPVKHIPKYEDEKELAMVLKKVSSFPPLVFAGETRALKKFVSSSC
jgi:3-deoxy-D-arabino-heptulosonate 7-phosphate (DAHP) synthase